MPQEDMGNLPHTHFQQNPVARGDGHFQALGNEKIGLQKGN